MCVVVMFEPAVLDEKLKLSEQVNEVFGPFDNEEQAENWTNRMNEVMKRNKKERQWLIIPLSNPSVVTQLDFGSN